MINRYLFIVFISFIGLIHSVSPSSTIIRVTPLIDSKLGENYVLDCPINRTQWSLPSIVQWFRAENNFSSPIASQFDDFPVHIDNQYVERYSLLANGSLKLVNIQLKDNDTFQCRLILIDRGLLDIKEVYSIIVRVNGKSIY